jgi:hypothetical protein
MISESKKKYGLSEFGNSAAGIWEFGMAGAQRRMLVYLAQSFLFLYGERTEKSRKKV